MLRSTRITAYTTRLPADLPYLPRFPVLPPVRALITHAACRTLGGVRNFGASAVVPCGYGPTVSAFWVLTLPQSTPSAGVFALVLPWAYGCCLPACLPPHPSVLLLFPGRWFMDDTRCGCSPFAGLAVRVIRLPYCLLALICSADYIRTIVT